MKAVHEEENRRGIVETSEHLKIIKKSIQEIMRSKRKNCSEFCDALIGFSTQQISESLKFLTTLRKTKAFVKTLESKHPYPDNSDDVTELSIPGAKYLKIVFDRRSATEEGCDYVQICKDETRSTFWNASPYQGRKDKSYWAGVGNTPPLIVKASKCFVVFHSDGSNSDWGYKLTCYGIMEEAEEEVKEEEREILGRYTSMTNLACWILEIVSKEHNIEISKKIFYQKTIRILRRYLEMVSWSRKLDIVNLIIDLSQQIHKVSVGEAATLELHSMKKTLIELMKTRHRIEISTVESKPSR